MTSVVRRCKAADNRWEREGGGVAAQAKGEGGWRRKQAKGEGGWWRWSSRGRGRLGGAGEEMDGVTTRPGKYRTIA
jgi:hypothetical protein